MAVTAPQKAIIAVTGVVAFCCVGLLPFILIYDIAHIEDAVVAPLDALILYPVLWTTAPFFVNRVLAARGITEIEHMYTYTTHVWLLLLAFILACCAYWFLILP